jgi:hypothetical protein
MLVYTISDLRENSIKCIDLLYKSLLYKNNKKFDFHIITNNPDYKNIITSKSYNIIYEDINSSYVGWLKYTKNLPIGYNHYYYFDSDILCYEDLTCLSSEDKDISLVREDKMMSSEWFCYPYASSYDKNLFNNINGVNAGTYVFNNLDFLKKVREKFEQHDVFSMDIHKQAMFEQSCFNYTVFESLINNNYHDITNYVKLFAKDSSSSHTIYHFCGFEGFMDNKFTRMNIFNQNYIK